MRPVLNTGHISIGYIFIFYIKVLQNITFYNSFYKGYRLKPLKNKAFRIILSLFELFRILLVLTVFAGKSRKNGYHFFLKKGDIFLSLRARIDIFIVLAFLKRE